MSEAGGWINDMPGTDHGSSFSRNGTFGIAGKQRMYLMEDAWVHDWFGAKYHIFNLLGKTVSYTVDLSQMPCGVAACLYFVANRKPGPGSNYCDIQPDYGGCFEIDLMEANSVAYEASLHTELGTRTAFDGTCNMNGCAVNIGRYPFTKSGVHTGKLYGPGADVINTKRPFQVEASVSKDGYMTVILLQGAQRLPFYNRTSADNSPGLSPGSAMHHAWYPEPGGIHKGEADKVVKAMQDGVRLVASVWTASDTSWLDGTGCDGQPHGNILDSKFSISDLRIFDTVPVAANAPEHAQDVSTTRPAKKNDKPAKNKTKPGLLPPGTPTNGTKMPGGWECFTKAQLDEAALKAGEKAKRSAEISMQRKLLEQHADLASLAGRHLELQRQYYNLQQQVGGTEGSIARQLLSGLGFLSLVALLGGVVAALRRNRSQQTACSCPAVSVSAREISSNDTYRNPEVDEGPEVILLQPERLQTTV
eukprot:CAMPEP_0172691612 /NCGR_PEP_ID=MMETSP1074-20121228/24675_1 /TAXON_ID=2916 /ORGANISM="Ceratium fusus, Strain PA161109" /LENGTH=475 /DNA_ID=CAMNT_0013511709 /DNA_START=145 /DNA_END=1572 /DNA_ORIENTATION=-